LVETEWGTGKEGVKMAENPGIGVPSPGAGRALPKSKARPGLRMKGEGEARRVMRNLLPNGMVHRGTFEEEGFLRGRGGRSGTWGTG